MTDDVVYPSKLLRFTLKGTIAVHYLDGEILQGMFAAQDAFNIFITVDNEPLMIPRQQIRYIKGVTGQGIEPDTSLETPTDDASTELPTALAAPPQIVVTQPLPAASDITASPSAPVPPPPQPDDSDDDDDGTMIIPPGHKDAVYDIGDENDEDDEDDDGTMILSLDDELTGAMLDSPYETSESMLKGMPALPVEEEFDITVVLGDSDLADELNLDATGEEQTIALGLDEGKELQATLTCTNGPHLGEVFQLSAGITTIGRSSDNAIVLFKDKEISRHHAIILFESDRFVVQDQNSLNGTFVNDEQISAPRYLENGDVVLVGVSYLTYELS